MKKELSINNSKKLIIGISILFCTVILIIGATTAYFTQSDSEDIDDIVSTNQVTLDYSDNDEFMLGELIPIDEDKVEYAYNREDNLKCKDDKGYNVCSIYQFTITNTGNVVQNIIIDLYPKVNGFTNLKFNLYNITTNEREIANKELILNSETPITLVNDLKLDITNNISNTYELVFYIKNDSNNDQSHLDAGQSFGANIKVDSVTTGFHVIEDLGDPGCWLPDENDSTIVSKFVGYTDKNGNQKLDEDEEIKKVCEQYFKRDTDNYYIVNVPSTYAGYNFTKVGNFLLTGFDFDETGEPSIPNEYNKIKSITISDEITTIGEIGEEAFSPSFALIGMGIEDPNYNLKIELPDNLITIGNMSFGGTPFPMLNIPDKVKYIGMSAFCGCNITTIDNPLIIPDSVIYIGEGSFAENLNLTKLEFKGLDTPVNENNKLTIKSHAFTYCNLEYQKADSPLELPARLTAIEEGAFYSSVGNDMNLHFIRYHGAKDTLNTFVENGRLWPVAKYIRTVEEYNVEEAKTYENIPVNIEE